MTSSRQPAWQARSTRAMSIWAGAEGDVVGQRGVLQVDRLGHVAEQAVPGVAFWLRHEIASGMQLHLSSSGKVQLDAIRRQIGQSKVRITMMMDPWLKETLQALSGPLGIGYQTLAHVYLAERVQTELERQGLQRKRA